MIINRWGRVINAKCPRCSKAICNCSTGCKCTESQLSSYYLQVGIREDAPLEGIKQEDKTIDVIMGEIQDMKKLGHMLWQELHELALHVKNVGGIYDDITVQGINIYFKAFIIKITCEECKQHYSDYISNNPFNGNTPRDLFTYVNDFHNAVNERLGRNQFEYASKVVDIARSLQRKGIINGLDIRKTTGGFNV